MDWGEESDGATPLAEEERAGLKPAWIITREDLNLAEADNILSGTRKWKRKLTSVARLLDDKAVRDLHRDLFGDVWRWAGTYRTVDLNIGLPSWQVPTSVRDLVLDAQYWFTAEGASAIDAAAARLHHRLVAIHPFPNGNGRHARALADLVLEAVGSEPFTWGSADLTVVGNTRKRYIAALRSADQGAYDALDEFVRS